MEIKAAMTNRNYTGVQDKQRGKPGKNNYSVVTKINLK